MKKISILFLDISPFTVRCIFFSVYSEVKDTFPLLTNYSNQLIFKVFGNHLQPQSCNFCKSSIMGFLCSLVHSQSIIKKEANIYSEMLCHSALFGRLIPPDTHFLSSPPIYIF